MTLNDTTDREHMADLGLEHWMSELWVVAVRIEQRVRAISLHELTFGDSVDQPPPVVGPSRKTGGGNLWKWAKAAYGGPHWDVQLKKGGYKNVYPNRNTRNGRNLK